LAEAECRGRGRRGRGRGLQLQLGEGGDGHAEGGSGAAKAKLLLLGRRRGRLLAPWRRVRGLIACEASSIITTTQQKHRQRTHGLVFL